MRPGIFILMLKLAVVPAFAEPAATVLAPDFLVDNRRAEDHASEWWKWAKSSPRNINPVYDLTGEHCAVGQTGRVWYLAGAFGSAKITRSCRIPENTYLFFPAVNIVYWPRRGVTTNTCDQAIASAAVNNDSALEVFVSVNDDLVDEPKRHRVRTTECFDIYERVPAELGAYRAYPSATDGYWFMLAPLPKGAHVLKFGGRYRSPDPREPYGQMVQDIEYRIVVE